LAKGYSIIISSTSSQNSKSFFIAKWKISFILFALLVTLGAVVLATVNYGSLYYRALKAKNFQQRYEEMEREFTKISEIKQNLAIAEMKNEKIKKMLGVDKTPAPAQPKITSANSNPAIRPQIYPENENIPSLMPTIGEISKKFGIGHSGIDIASPQFSPVIATASGIITETGWDAIFGNYLVIEHNKNYSTFYGHLNSLKKKIGEKVSCGEVIGTVGSSGKSTSPHLHYEIRFQGNAVDPIGYLPFFVNL